MQKGVRPCTEDGPDHRADHLIDHGAVNGSVVGSMHDATPRETRITGFEAESASYAADENAPVTEAGCSESAVVDTDRLTDPSPHRAPKQYTYTETYGQIDKYEVREAGADLGNSEVKDLEPVDVGKVEPVDSGKVDSGKVEDLGPAEVEEWDPEEWEVLEPEKERSGGDSGGANPEARLAHEYWKRLEFLPRYEGVQQQWANTFAYLLQTYTFEILLGSIQSAFEDEFWSPLIFRRNGDPVLYFASQIKHLSLTWVEFAPSAETSHQEATILRGPPDGHSWVNCPFPSTSPRRSPQDSGGEGKKQTLGGGDRPVPGRGGREDPQKRRLR